MPPVVDLITVFLVEDLAIGAATAATIATIAVNLALSTAFTVIAGLIAGGPKKPAPPHASRSNFRNPVAPRQVAFGRVKMGGPLMLLNVVPEHYLGKDLHSLYAVVAQGQGRWDRHEEYWLGDGRVVLDGDVVVQPVNYHWNNYPYARIESRIGSDTQTAMSMLTAGLPGQWTDDFRGFGIPYLAMRLRSPTAENFTNVFPAGLPALLSVARATRVWDPRNRLQHYTSPDTWRWSANGVLCLLHTVWSADGLGLPIDMVLAGREVWEMEADWCDQWRPLANGGSEPWYRIGGAFTLDQPPKTWLQKMLDPMDAMLMLRADGAIVPSVGRWTPPELTLGDDDIRSYNLSRGRARGDVRNRIDATFVSPDYDFIQQQADSILNEDSIGVDGEQSLSLDLDFSPSHAQTRYRMNIEKFRQDPDGWTGTVVSGPACLNFLTPNADGSVKRFIHLVIADLGIDDDFEVQKFAFDVMSGQGTLQVVQMWPEAYDWDPSDEGTPPEFPRTVASNDVENPHGLAIAVAGAQISATFDAPLDGSLSFELGYRLTADAIGDGEASWTELTHAGNGGHTGSLGNGRYDIRVRFKKTLENGTILYSDPRVIRGIKVGTGARVAAALAAPSGFSVTDCGGQTVLVQLAVPADISVVGAQLWAAAGFGSAFADAAVVAEFDLVSGQSLSEFVALDTSGDTNFWATTRSILSADTSAQAGPVAVTVTGGAFSDPAPVPSPPSNLRLTVGASNILVEWDANAPGDAVTAYTVVAGAGANGEAEAVPVGTTGATSWRITDLDPGTDVNVSVIATNANGDSVAAETISVTTLSLDRYRAADIESSPFQLADTDTWADLKNTTGGPVEIRMPQYPVRGQAIRITDREGTIDGTNTWTLVPYGGGTPIAVLDTAGDHAVVGFTGADFRAGGGATVWPTAQPVLLDAGGGPLLTEDGREILL